MCAFARNTGPKQASPLLRTHPDMPSWASNSKVRHTPWASNFREAQVRCLGKSGKVWDSTQIPGFDGIRIFDEKLQDQTQKVSRRNRSSHKSFWTFTGNLLKGLIKLEIHFFFWRSWWKLMKQWKLTSPGCTLSNGTQEVPKPLPKQQRKVQSCGRWNDFGWRWNCWFLKMLKWWLWEFVLSFCWGYLNQICYFVWTTWGFDHETRLNWMMMNLKDAPGNVNKKLEVQSWFFITSSLDEIWNNFDTVCAWNFFSRSVWNRVDLGPG